MNSKLAKLGLELQKDTQTFREKAQLKTCNIRYKTFCKKEWISACKRTSLVNILDQHFAVRLTTLPKESKDSDHSHCDHDEVKVVNEFDYCSPPDYIVQPPTSY